MNGNEYQGQFLDDYKHGLGEMRYFDGRIHKGHWDRGKIVNDENTVKVALKNT